MYSYIFDKRTGGYLLNTKNSQYISNEIRPVFAEELIITGLANFLDFDPHESNPLLWSIKNTYIIADIDEKGQPYGRKIAQINNAQYGKPLNIQTFFDGRLRLNAVDVEQMLFLNSSIMEILASDAKRRTKELYEEKLASCDIAYIAFSGGKDSVALLDICDKVLPLSVPVIFSDTDMEFPDTYDIWKEIASLYPDREFIRAKADKPALENWRIFGPPSRTIRWCCSVHKSTPALICLKKRLGKSAIKAKAFVGVRGEESHSRSFYEDFSDGVKNASQINCMPLLDWGAHELWLYIFANNLPVNEAYKKGIARVGCILCPDSASRYMWFSHHAYPQIMKNYSDIIINTSIKYFHLEEEKENFINSIDWGARKSGVILKDTLTDPLQTDNGLTTTFQSPHFQKHIFFEWIKTLGVVGKERSSNKNILKIGNGIKANIVFEYYAPYTGGGIITFIFNSELDRSNNISIIRSLLKKTIGCISCQSCEAQCNFGAIGNKDGRISIDASKCKHCYRCHELHLSCWRFKSMYKSASDNHGMTGINRYNHFGLREEWIIVLNEMSDKFFPWITGHPLGNKMVDSASAWFKQALLIEPRTRKRMPLANLFALKGASYMPAWEMIWMALANNTVLVKWFICNTEINSRIGYDHLFQILSDSYASLGDSTKKDGLTSLKETLARNPLGKDGGVAQCEFKGKRLQSITRKAKNVHPLTILYGLYLIAGLAGRGNFTVRELLTADMNSTFVSPIVAFGISPDTFKKQCEGLRTRYPEYISTTFTHGNDALDVYPEKHTLVDIINLALEI